ncbi:hypothetical protein F8B91_14695 [Aestuariivirga litoralis]|nr:hypothetical protein [Aestuariivirga litoralis]MBG1233586.1 hypothetical protein [Aestuariivirga litoralis]
MLTASLHGAVVAAAYNVPFAFWDNGFVDLPFKWQDFSSSLGIDCDFVSDTQSGLVVYKEKILPRMKKPRLLPILKVCPFSVHSRLLLKAYMADRRAAKSNRG